MQILSHTEFVSSDDDDDEHLRALIFFPAHSISLIQTEYLNYYNDTPAELCPLAE